MLRGKLGESGLWGKDLMEYSASRAPGITITPLAGKGKPPRQKIPSLRTLSPSPYPE